MNNATASEERAAPEVDQAADDLLPVVYERLRRWAHHQLTREAPGQSLQSVDLVHETYLRLTRSGQKWQGQRHFLGAAAEAMRRILVERARRKRRLKHGGRWRRVELADPATPRQLAGPDEVIVVSELLEVLEKQHPLEAQIVSLHYFAGLNISEVGRTLGIPRSTTHRHWKFARAWLHQAMQDVDYDA
jgi:RNA polymerase sigma factor (TIGR02999 family)